MEEEVGRTFNSDGTVNSVTAESYEVIPVGEHTSFPLHLSHNRSRLPAREAAAERRRLEARLHESAADKHLRFQRELEDRAYMEEVPDAFDFRIIGTQKLPTGPAWVLQATPHRGYRTHTRYARAFSGVSGKLWIDQRDLQWVKADAEAVNPVSFGPFITRLDKGSHITIEQMRLPDGEWVPKRIQARARARMLLLFSQDFEETITYNHFHFAGPAPH
jgi:hypothetical protein